MQTLEIYKILLADNRFVTRLWEWWQKYRGSVSDKKRDFPLSKTSNLRRTMFSYSRIKRTGRENYKSLPSRAEVKNAWMFASNFPQYLQRCA
jgi:hypothetical protein